LAQIISKALLSVLLAILLVVKLGFNHYLLKFNGLRDKSQKEISIIITNLSYDTKVIVPMGGYLYQFFIKLKVFKFGTVITIEEVRSIPKILMGLNPCVACFYLKQTKPLTNNIGSFSFQCISLYSGAVVL